MSQSLQNGIKNQPLLRLLKGPWEPCYLSNFQVQLYLKCHMQHWLVYWKGFNTGKCFCKVRENAYQPRHIENVPLMEFWWDIRQLKCWHKGYKSIVSNACWLLAANTCYAKLLHGGDYKHLNGFLHSPSNALFARVLSCWDLDDVRCGTTWHQYILVCPCSTGYSFCSIHTCSSVMWW